MSNFFLPTLRGGYCNGNDLLPNVRGIIPQTRWIYDYQDTLDDTALIQTAINPFSTFEPGCE
jgi:hypothetical protein